jgi:CDP-glucose 4,6-dehydratase
LDCSKAAKHLGWKPQMHLQEAIAHVMDWHRHGKAGKNMSEFMSQRIAAYQENFIPSP